MVFNLLPQIRPRIGESADLPSRPPSRQASFYDQEEKVLYVATEAMTWHPVTIQYSTVSVSVPPTNAELEAEFGAASTLGSQFAVIINVGGSDTNLYLVVTSGNDFWYIALTKAV